jgi:hypothetical protein
MARHGKVNMFGLDEFGSPAGIEPYWGAVAGPGISAGTAVAVRGLASGKVAEWSEGIGGLVGALSGGLMMIFSQTRGAGLVTLLSSLVSAIPRQLERSLNADDPATAAAVKAGKDAAKAIQTAQQQSAGFGLTTAEPAQLMGPPISNQGPLQQNIAAQQVGAYGGPALTNFSPFYGSTVMGGGN